LLRIPLLGIALLRLALLGIPLLGIPLLRVPLLGIALLGIALLRVPLLRRGRVALTVTRRLLRITAPAGRSVGVAHRRSASVGLEVEGAGVERAARSTTVSALRERRR
jgi:hypothetical protein